MASGAPLAFDPIAEAQRQWEAHGWDDAAPGMAMVTSVMRVQQVLIGHVDRALRDLGLTFARYEVLMLLLFSRKGALPMGKVGARLQVHPASVTNVVDRLEADGLVRRVPHPSDGRTTLAEITPAGRALARRATDALERGRVRAGSPDPLAGRPARRPAPPPAGGRGRLRSSLRRWVPSDGARGRGSGCGTHCLDLDGVEPIASPTGGTRRPAPDEGWAVDLPKTWTSK